MCVCVGGGREVATVTIGIIMAPPASLKESIHWNLEARIFCLGLPASIKGLETVPLCIVTNRLPLAIESIAHSYRVNLLV